MFLFISFKNVKVITGLKTTKGKKLVIKFGQPLVLRYQQLVITWSCSVLPSLGGWVKFKHSRQITASDLES